MLKRVYERFPLDKMITHHRTETANQFIYKNGKGKTACIPLCVQALYHLHESLTVNNELLNDSQWEMVMDRGIRVWELWRERNKRVESNFPHIEDIIRMPECEGFYRLFSEKSEEYNGLVTDSGWIDNVQGPLTRVVSALFKERKASCALIVLPHHTAIGLIRHGTLIYLFDSHGRSGTQETELTQFMNPRDVVPYLIKKYQLDNIDDMEPHKGIVYSELEIAHMYAYSASVFTTK